MGIVFIMRKILTLKWGKYKKGNPSMDKLVIYQTEDSKTDIAVSFDQDTVWLTQQQISELFSTSRENITMHLKNIFQQEELAENSVCKNFLRTAKDYCFRTNVYFT
mgnify:CR=1 FL=1